MERVDFSLNPAKGRRSTDLEERLRIILFPASFFP